LFISNQKHVVDSALDAIIAYKKRCFLIKGMSGVGKSFVLGKIETSASAIHGISVFYISGDKYFPNRSYFPFYNFIPCLEKTPASM